MNLTPGTTTISTTTDDFRSTKTFAAAPDAVFSALTDIDALTGWWTPAAGGAEAGGTLRFLMGDQEVVMRVDEADRPSRVGWSVSRLRARPRLGRDLDHLRSRAHRRRHRAALPTTTASTPRLECFETCHAGWTHFLASLVDYVDRGAGSPNPPADVERFAAWHAEHAAH